VFHSWYRDGRSKADMTSTHQMGAAVHSPSGTVPAATSSSAGWLDLAAPAATAAMLHAPDDRIRRDNAHLSERPLL
jgi:hypothetical protein